ncbi:CD1247 N-terminal domain-containing protein [Clostridium sp. B9]|uniref:CD1247 N-terminal domain-containing protein n=1 Tax=Clostridium sp. B9 TaxID=3423224 RepID=UPI003D2F17E9
MKDIRENISTLLEAMNKNTELDKEFKDSLLNVISSLVEKVEELQVNVETLDENIELLNDDLSGVQDELFEELTLEELEEYEDEYCEVVCDKCHKAIYIEKNILDKAESIPCPYCGNEFEV